MRPRCGGEVAEDVLSSLEFDLTQLDSSDDEPLLRPVEGRHVVPRVGCTVPPTVADSTTADFPPIVVDSLYQSIVWPDAQVQSSSEGGIKSVQEFLRTTAEPAVRQSELDCKHVATFAERRCRFFGCSQALTVPAPLSTLEGAVHSQVNIFQPSDDEMSRSTLSDTESCEVEEPAAHRRRLRLPWRQPRPPGGCESCRAFG